MPKSFYVLNLKATDPSGGFQDADGVKPYLEFDESTDPPSAQLYLPGTQIVGCDTLTIVSGVLIVPGPGTYWVNPEGYPSVRSDLITTIQGCNDGESVILMPQANCTIGLTYGAASGGIQLPNLAATLYLGATTQYPCIQLTRVSVSGFVAWLIPSLPTGVLSEIRTFTQTEGAGIYTATVELPSDCTVLDVRWSNQVVWGGGTSAVLDVGDGNDADGYFAAVNVKAAPVADVAGAGGISCFKGDTGAGAYGGLTKYSSAPLTITATVTVVGADTGGKSRLVVLYCVGTEKAAVKV